MNALPAFVASILASSVALAASGCSAPAPDDSSAESGESAQALRSCGAVKYNAALAHYKNAVAWSKDRLRQGVCESENGLLWSIADEASRAVMTCSDFRGVIKSSPWAAPLRTTLEPSLTLRSLTGELLVIKDSSHQNWSGVESLFQDGGLRFWARAEGAYGSRVRLTFGANGTATWSELVYDEVSGDISLVDVASTFTFAPAITSSTRRTVTVSHGAKTDVFTLAVEDASEYKAAPLFVLEPQPGIPSVAGSGDAPTPKLYSLVSECDA